jgi:hypothetical protein
METLPRQASDLFAAFVVVLIGVRSLSTLRADFLAAANGKVARRRFLVLRTTELATEFARARGKA